MTSVSEGVNMETIMGKIQNKERIAKQATKIVKLEKMRFDEINFTMFPKI